MNILLILTFILSSFVTDAEKSISSDQNWTTIDQHALEAPRRSERSVERLSTYFLEKADTEQEKARIIYRWMTDRISYDTDAFFMGDISNTSSMEVLRFRKAVCSGYAVLFRDLAEAMDLEVKIVSGHSKGYGFDPDKVSTLADNHAWIVAKIDGQWKIIDPTWGAGHIPVDSRNFVKNFSEFYFFADPEKIIYTHFPSDPNWQLLDVPIDQETYLNQPLISTYFFQLGMEIGDKNNLYIETDGFFETTFGVPPNVALTAILRHTESREEQDVFLRYLSGSIEMQSNLRRSGNYNLNIFARELDDDGETYHQVINYVIRNQQAGEDFHYPEILGYYNMTRANLQSPLYRNLKSNQTYEFKIAIPGATEAYLADGDSWIAKELIDDFFTVTYSPETDKVMIVAKVDGREHYGILVSYDVELIAEDIAE